MQNHNGTIIKMNEAMKTSEDFFKKTYLSLYLKGSKRLMFFLIIIY